MINNIKTPYYLLDIDKLEKNFNNLEQAFKKEWNNLIIGYSFKTNSLPWLITFLKKIGCYAEVVSKQEYELAKKLGYTADNIIYNGPVKSKETFKEAVNNNAIINIDSSQEVQWLREIEINREIKIGIRVNFDLEKVCPGETPNGKLGSRFGINYENGELEEVINILKQMKNIKINGLHLHNSSKTRSLNIYKAISKKALEIVSKYDLELDYLDIGGGFFGDGSYEKYQNYAKNIAEELRKHFKEEDLTLIIEPGACLVATVIDFITEIISIKNVKDSRILTLNGGSINVNPLMREKKYSIKIETKENKKIKKQILVGQTCMENDILQELFNENELNVKDKIVFENVGSYTMTLSPLFIEYFPKVIAKKLDKYFVVREEWTCEELLQKNYY